jgi:predicted enzyme related to lactoylglutathione lyase
MESLDNIQEAFLTIGTEKFAEVVDFYRQFLDQDPNPYNPTKYAEFQLQGLRLAIFCPKSDHKKEFSQVGGSAFSLCLAVKDLDSAIAHLQNLGYSPTTEIQTASHGREIYVYDPAHNRLILYQPN